jgi:hypothetical protein
LVFLLLDELRVEVLFVGLDLLRLVRVLPLDFDAVLDVLRAIVLRIIAQMVWL